MSYRHSPLLCAEHCQHKKEYRAANFSVQPVPRKEDMVCLPRRFKVMASEDAMPYRFSLKTGPLLEQGSIGTCSSCVISASIMTQQLNGPDGAIGIHISRLFLYYLERLLSMDPGQTQVIDNGAINMDGIEALHKQGVCHETTWPYDYTKVNVRPSKEAYEEAKLNRGMVKAYGSIKTDGNFIQNIKKSLLANIPVLISLQIFPAFYSFEVRRTGMVPMPTPGQKQIGGHELLIVGYDDEKRVFKCQNSWGPRWGDGGFCYFPYNYINNRTWTFDASVFQIKQEKRQLVLLSSIMPS